MGLNRGALRRVIRPTVRRGPCQAFRETSSIVETTTGSSLPNVRFGSVADTSAVMEVVRFVPEANLMHGATLGQSMLTVSRAGIVISWISSELDEG
jgi:hypothetical protein